MSTRASWVLCPGAFLRASLPSSVYQPFFERARAEGWRYRELNGGHYAMLTVPNVVVTALLELADDARGRMSTSGLTGDG